MKYLIAIIICAIVIGGLLTISVYFLFGSDAGFFVAKFIATPVGLVGGIGCFLLYDSIWPKNKPDNDIKH